MGSPRLPGTPRLLRALNDRAALELLIARGPLTRAQLGELTGLSKVTASQLVERLEGRGLVTRVGEQAGGRGPNAQLYAVQPASAHVVGVDVGPDRVVAACADITGSVIGRVEQSTRDTDDPVGVVHNAVVQAASSAETQLASVRRVVLGTPGLVDPANGDITFAYNLPRWHRGLLAALREDLDTTVVFENDVNLAAVAEAHAGAARDVPDFVLVWAGVGVGLAIMLGGRLHHGSTGAAGEIGYLPVPGAPIPRDVSRRAKPAFQQLAGADAVRAVAREHGFRAASAGDAVRAAIAAGTRGGPLLDELARRLALGVASSCVVLDPPLVVLTGEVGQAGGSALAERVQHEVAAITLVAPRVVVTELTEEPVLQGALRTALDAARDEVFGSTVA
ncbi:MULTISPECIES: ROK family transcriptional regulator [unclassified Solwaraspora]|uniref:ROK family transcriptional regulator n=1 Tax=unclassified Solwaraspora TaxID=2627926 RepID=UPI0024167212|nr:MULTISPECIES: ROK family transcriptional regulator [unclassified Solwaraspora]MDG4769548.1 ROK family transcriptional regulator [Solwaraspora sp. WMMD792]WBB98365.1 ROK family transcriptional regulator [Solwaraspora sp. WMMA2059]WBC23082.1 ROK family transcriptional regulator [Solwaraspora sp. WMMA2080]WFE24281.1 ROK family transcriptional regulator [Solwaraspora sp. WMMD937]